MQKIVGRARTCEPLRQLGEAVVEAYARLVTEQTLRLADIGEAMADVAAAEFPGDDRLDARAEHLDHGVRDFEDGAWPPRADVEDIAGIRRRQRQLARLHDVAHADEIAALHAVFEDQ